MSKYKEIIKGKGKYSILLILSIIILIIVGIVYFIQSSNISNDNIEITTYRYEEALSYGNISMCDNLDNMRDSELCKLKLTNCTDNDCLLKKARIESNVTMCYNITNETKRIACSSSITFFGTRKDAVLENNISICEKFDDNVLVTSCRDNFYRAKRINSNDLSMCENIINEDIKTKCLNYKEVNIE